MGVLGHPLADAAASAGADIFRDEPYERRLATLFQQATELLQRIVFIEISRAEARPTHVARPSDALPLEPGEQSYHEEHLASFLNAGHVIRINR